jgi:excisionase family DNA binding protein
METLTWHTHHNDLPDLRHEEYTVVELAEILGVGRELLLHAIRTGELKAVQVNAHTISIKREDSVDWLKRRGQLF